jgi:hypothetical protein
MARGSRISVLGLYTYDKTLFDEIIAMIDAGDKFPEKMLGLNDKTATDFYTEENGCASAYIDFVEYICGIIPDCD